MSQPNKIKVLYFDESDNTMSAFIKLCASRENIEVVGAFRSFAMLSPLLIKNNYELMKTLDPQVIVIKVSENESDIYTALHNLRKYCNVRFVGILCGNCANNKNLVASFDYYVTSSYKNSLITDESIGFRVMYHIKNAQLMLNAEKCGVKGKWAALPLPPKHKTWKLMQYKMIAIGASAGGTEAVTEILTALPTDMPPILLVQHLPETFSDFFASNLASKISLNVCVARGGERLENGNVYIAGYDKHLEIVKSEDGAFHTKCTYADKVSGHRPSVDVLFHSIANVAGASAVGIILTGMGNDGAQGLLEMHESGAYTIGQDKETCIVYGMPMVAYALGAVTKQLPLGSIAKDIINAVTHGEREEKK